MLLLAAALQIAGHTATRYPLLVSATPGGIAGTGESHSPVITPGSHRIAFVSDASDLVPGDTNGVADVFVRDVLSGETVRVSLATDGSQPSAPSYSPALDETGNLVAFATAAPLVPEDTNGVTDVYLRDLAAGLLTRVSISSTGQQGRQSTDNPALVTVAISGDGTRVAFTSALIGLVPADANAYDVFVRDWTNNTTSLASISSSGEQANRNCTEVSLSGDGTVVAFVTNATNLLPGGGNGIRQVYARNLATGVTEVASVAPDGSLGDGPSGVPSLDYYGSRLVFTSLALNLGEVDGPPRRPHVYRRRLFSSTPGSATTTMVSRSAAGDPVSGTSGRYSQSPNGGFVAFVSPEDGVAGSEENGLPDLFLRDLRSGFTTTRLVSISRTGDAADGAPSEPALAYDDPFSWSTEAPNTVYVSQAGNLVSEDSNSRRDVYFQSVPVVVAAPSNLQAAAVTPTGATLHWSDNSDNELGFEVLLGNTVVARVGRNATTHQLMGLVPNTRTAVRVRAFNAAERSLQVTIFLQTPQNPPDAPRNLTAAPAEGAVHLAWSAVARAQQYLLYRSLTGGGPYALVARIAGWATTFDDSKTGAGTRYYYVLRAWNSAGEGPPSEEVTAVPLPVRPSTPTNLRATPLGGAVWLAWSPAARAEYYVVSRGAAAQGPFAPVGGRLTDTTWTDGNLGGGKTWHYIVEAFNAGGGSGHLPAVEATSLPVLLKLTVSPSSVRGGKAARLVATLDVPAPAGGVTVQLRSGRPAAVRVPAGLFVPPDVRTGEVRAVTRRVRKRTTAVITGELGEVRQVARLKVQR